MVVFGQKLFYTSKSCCNRAKVVHILTNWLYSGKSGCIRAEVVVIEQKLLYSGKMVIVR